MATRFVPRVRQPFATPSCVILCLMLAGCGGGGGGGGGGTTTAAPTGSQQTNTFPRTETAMVTIPPDDSGYDTRRANFESSPDYDVDFDVTLSNGRNIRGADLHLRQVNAAAAYARGATGAGETIVVVDSGIDASHQEFQGGKVRVVTGIGDSCSPSDAAAGRCSGAEHGTAVAAVAAGRRGVGPMHGVAFDANINFIPISLRGSSSTLPPLLHLNAYDFAPGDRQFFDDSSDYRQYIRQGKILNYSFGAPWSLSEWRTLSGNCGGINEVGSLACFRYYYRRNAVALAQTGTRPEDKSIVVIAAGNRNGGRHDRDNNGDGLGRRIDATSPTADAALAVAFNREGDPDLSNVITVVAVGANGRIASYSNRCGDARAFCIAAPGGDFDADNNIIYSATNGGGYDLWQGTSFAAPVVSGALAVLRQFFRHPDTGEPQVDGVDLVNRLLATANDEGRYANSRTYGHGLVDLAAATAPVGMVMAGMPGSVGNRPLAGGFSVTGGAFGGALGDALAGVSVAGFDALGAPFLVPAAAMVSHARRRAAADTTVDIPLAAGAAGITVSGGHGHAAANYDRTVIPAGRRYPVVHGRQSSGEVWSWTANLAGDTLASPTAGGVATGAVGATPRLSLTVDAAGAVTAARYKTAAGWWLGYANDAGRELGLSAASSAAAASASPLINESFAAPYLSLVRDGPAVGKRGDRLGFALLHGAPRFDGYADADGERGVGVVVDWRVGGHTLINRGGGADFSLQAGVVSEPDGVLGARATDAFGALAGETAFVGVQGAWVVGGGHGGGGGGYRHGGVVGSHGGGVGDGWRLAASAFIGNTRADAGDGFVSGVGGVTSDAFAVTAARGGLWRRGDRLNLAVSQPLRVADGDLTLTLPAGRTRYGEVIRRRHRLALAPAGRAVRVGAVYQAPVAAGVVTGTVAVTRHPNHDPDADDEALVKVSFSKSF